MQKRSNHIPENRLPSGIREGVYIARVCCNGLPNIEEVERSHRDNGHIFILQEAGATRMEIDFQTHLIAASSIMYIHPSQVHRLMGYENATTVSWIITNENLHPEYQKILDALAPVNTLPLPAQTLAVISAAASLCIQLSQRKQEKLFEPILKESCNTLVALVASQFLAVEKTTDSASRFEAITQSFKALLEQCFLTIKSPAHYAERLNISTPYLNECVKNVTGYPVSKLIQQRVVLEAKRLLYHSDKSVKEIAGQLGYDDYSYFTRLFVKTAGVTPVAFRNKNFD